MPRPDQPDLFATETQADLFNEDAPAREYRADPDKVRARLCGFRGKAATDSDGRRPPNPIESGHLIRTRAATLLMG